MDVETLQDLGLTQAEAKVYITLLGLGLVKVGQIIKKSGLQSSTVHNVLHSLIDNGFVSFIRKGKIKYYQATEPRIILQYFKDKEKRFEELIPQLEIKRKLAKEKTQAEIFEDFKGVTTALNILIEDARPRDVYRFFSTDVDRSNIAIQKFFIRYDAKRKAKRLIVKGLARRKLKPLFEKRKYLKMKYADFPIPSNIGICNDKMVLIDWGERPVAILIYSKQIIQKQIEFFDGVWEKI